MYTAKWKEVYDIQERQLWTIQKYALDLIAEEEHTYQETEEDCVACYLALARFARLSALDMHRGVDDAEVAFATWQEYAEAEEYEEGAEEYEGYDFIDGQWVHPTRGPYDNGEEYDTTATEDYGDYDDEDDDDAKTGTATPESLGLGPEQHYQIFTPGRDGQGANSTPVT